MSLDANTTVTADTAGEGAAAVESAEGTTLLTGVEAGGDGDAGEGDNGGTLLTDGDQPEDGKPAEEAAKPEGAPEEYAEFTAPDGIVLDETTLGDFKGIAKELNLTQDAAQKLVDIGVKMRQADAEAIVAVRAGWLESTKTDAEIGGAKLAETVATAKRGMEAYASPALVTLLNETGLGNHPEIIRTFAKIGKTVSEDNFVPGGKAPSGQRTLAERLYGTKE